MPQRESNPWEVRQRVSYQPPTDRGARAETADSSLSLPVLLLRWIGKPFVGLAGWVATAIQMGILITCGALFLVLVRSSDRSFMLLPSGRDTFDGIRRVVQPDGAVLLTGVSVIVPLVLLAIGVAILKAPAWLLAPLEPEVQDPERLKFRRHRGGMARTIGFVLFVVGTFLLSVRAADVLVRAFSDLAQRY